MRSPRRASSPFHRSLDAQPYLTLCFVLTLTLGLTPPAIAAAGPDWPVALGDPGQQHYSRLDQIHPGNVRNLEVAWIYRSGDAQPQRSSQIQCNPIIVDGTLYGTTPGLHLFALDAATGQERWRFDPFAGQSDPPALGVNRGVVLWQAGSESRVLFTAGTHLFAIDPATGKPIPSFGKQGRVDIRADLGRNPEELFVLGNTPGALYQDLLILPTRVSEGPGASAPGHIRAYNVRTGKLAWRFHTIPQPGEPGYETWPPDAWQTIGGANCWAGMAVDIDRGLVFVPTGSAAFDFWGGDRLGDNLYANCLIALDARTGHRRWHYQIVRHDLWDRDLPAPPTLVTVQHQGRPVDAVAQVTKSGHVFLFDRDNGTPLFPIEERPAPRSDLLGEATAPTQPVPVRPPPFTRQFFSEDIITDRTPEARAAVFARWRQVLPHQPWLPPRTNGTIIFPGFDGGAEWGGAAFHPASGHLFVNANEMPWILTMLETQAATGEGNLGTPRQFYDAVCAACHGLDRSGDPSRSIPGLTQLQPRLSEDAIVQLLETGRGVMPGFGFLSLEHRRGLARLLLDIEDPNNSPSSSSSTQTRTESQTAERHPEPTPASSTAGATIQSPYSHTGYHRWNDPDGYPAVRPPWGTLTAINLNEGTLSWQIPLGEWPELIAQGLPPTGTENYGGPIVTASGLLFIAATRDAKIRAFDIHQGRELWRADLPAAGYATPSTYSVNGRQYVVIACGGGKLGTPSGDAYVAFALPQ